MKAPNLVLLMLLLLIANNTTAQSVQSVSMAGNQNTFTCVEPPQIYLYRNQLGKIATADFQVDYDINVPTAARTAFDKAIDIWKYLIVLSKTVKIKVTFVNEPNSGMLGSTGVETWRNNYNDFPFDDIQYPISLAKHLDHSISYNEYDIDMVFNSAQNFNYETNGIPVENKFDFITVALHEIGHGLGLAGSFYVDLNYGYFGLNDYPLVTTGTYPTISDKFYVSGPIRLINVSNPNILGNLLVSDDVYFDGTNAKALNNNQNVKLFAPAEWSNSSIDHLDENTFPPGNQNSLMTPYIDMAEVNHNPGEIFLGMLRDYGHTVSRIINFIKPAASNQLVKGQNYNITWSDNISDFGDYINFELYKITSGDPVFVETINHNEPVWSNPGSSGNSFEWEVLNSYENNFYFLRAVGTNNSVDYGQSNVFVISNVPEAPHFNPPGSQYAGAQSVQLYTTTPVSEIRYVIGNSEPNQNSTNYTVPISVPNSMRIRAKSFLVLADNTVVASPVSDAYYFINSNSFVMEKLTNTNEYGWIYRRPQGGVYNYNHDYNELKVGFKPPAPDYNNVYRSYAKWTGFRTIIPSGSIIQSVEFEIPFNPSNSSASIEFRYYSPLPGSDWPQKWDHIGEGTPVATMPANSSVFNVQEFVSYIQNVVNGSGNDYFGIGIKNANENNSSDFVNFIFPVKIRVYYRGNVEVTQLDKDNDPFGQVGYWNGTYWDGKNVPATFFKTNNITLKSDQDWYSSNQKYYNWLDQTDVVNHYTFSIGTGVNYFTAQFNEVSQTPKVKNSYELSTIDPQGDNIWFRDPWLVDELDGVYGMRNQGMFGGNQGDPGADWYEKDSPIDFSLPEFANYKGVFLNQDPSQTQIYYSVKAELTQDLTLYNTGNSSGRNHHFIFQNWSGTNVAFEDANARGTGVVFTDINAVASANYKGTQLSNNQNAFENNGQRKFVRTYDQQYNTTRFHLVYESMNKVWYERSTDGINWEIMNNGQPIYEGIGKHPSIDALPGTHNVIIVYNKDEWEIAAQYYEDGIFKFESIVCANGWVSNAKPVIACGFSRFLVAWDDFYRNINYRFGQLCTQTLPPGYYFNWYFDYKVVTYSPNTIKNNLTIAAAVRTSDYKSYWLAWDSNQSAIQVVNLKTTDDVNFQESQAFTFDQTGFSKNYKPSIIVWKNGNETYDRVRVNWIAFRKTYPDSPSGGGEQFVGESKVFFRSYDDGVWSAYNSYGVNVTSVNINKNSDNSYAFAWSEGDGIMNKFIRSDNLTNIRTQNTNGKYLQVGNYANLNSMRLMSFKTSAPPYYFLLSNAFNWIPPQQIEPPITDREGVITKDTTSLYFSMGEITVDGEKINFLELPDTLVVSGSEALNTYLISEPFNLTENTFFTYGVQYGVTDSLSAAMTLTEGKSVNFRVELIDEQTNEVLGTFDDVTFSEGSIIPYKSIAYQVNTEGIGNRICRLRLVIDDNLYPEYSLTNDYNGEAVLSKQGFVERTLSVNEIVKTYDLEQNYPNPFNPVTTIRYQLPKEGLVTLKVYDILGSEVATLVNEQKTTGKYEANFNASRLASGVYIYRLQANDYISVKKMVLLK